MNRRTCILLALLVVTTLELALGQRRRGPRFNYDRSGIPGWNEHPTMPRDEFTFVRIRYTSRGGGWGYGGGVWWTDTPDADLNLSYRLHSMTSWKVNPNPLDFDLELTDPRLYDFPFIYIVEPGRLEFSEEEVAALRNYLLTGGFLMVDDFWGQTEWNNFYHEIKRVFPDREPKELEMNHPIFNIVFALKMRKNELQVPNVNQGMQSQWDGVTWEENHIGGNTRDVHIRGIFDDKQRLMVVICHNTDNGDGWEQEGQYEYFFREFSEKKAYPLFINLLFYVMTH
jgi:hypothetical protein